MSDSENREAYELSMLGLDKLLKALKNKAPMAKLGVLGTTGERKEGEVTNAEILQKHEFGEDGMPVRSVLRVPLMDNMQRFLEEAGYFDPETFKKILRTSDLTELVAQVGIVGERVVSEAFATGGFGKWPASDMTHKTNHQTLVETTQLRDSITSEVSTDD